MKIYDTHLLFSLLYLFCGFRSFNLYKSSKNLFRKESFDLKEKLLIFFSVTMISIKTVISVIH